MSARLRPLELARGAWGLACVVAPAAMVQTVGGAPADHRAVVVTRVLGARHLVQAGFTAVAPGPAVLAAGTWVDVVHALTAVGFAAVDPRRARLSLIDALVATAWSQAARRDAATARPRRTSGGQLVWSERLARTVLPVLPFAPRPRTA